jgi:hypothetical protein
VIDQEDATRRSTSVAFSRDRLPDLQQYIDGDRGDYVSKGVRVVPVDLLLWLETEIRYQRAMAKRFRELDEAS